MSILNASTTAATPVSSLRALPFLFSDVRIDPINNIDLSLLKDIFFREEMRLQLRFEAINAFDEPPFPGPVANPASPTFGQISASNQNNYARRVQLGIKFLF